MIAGIETPDRGKIIADGRTLFDSGRKINVRTQERGTGYLFQNYALFPNMTVRQNITIAGKAARSGKEALVQDLIRRFELEGLENSYPVSLSGGQQQLSRFRHSTAPCATKCSWNLKKILRTFRELLFL